MATASLPHPPQPAWQLARRVVSWLWLAFATLAGGAVGAVTFFAAARLTSYIWLMSLAALVVCLILSTALAWPASRGLCVRRPPQAALVTGAATTLVLAVLAALTIFKPLAPPQALPPLPHGAAYWDLPTGSRIAYLHVPAHGAPQPAPVIVLHGGPGAFEVTALAGPFYGTFAQDGFDVYLYDQVGSGHSARLADPRQYTVDRHVADLEAVRRQTGAERVILIGDSWGATLAANYMAVHPDRVAKVIFTSPGAMSRADQRGGLTPANRLSPQEQQASAAVLEAPRFKAWQLLMGLNPEAGIRFIPEDELDGFADAIIASFVKGAVADTSRLPSEGAGVGFGFWSVTMVNVDMNTRRADPHAALRRNSTPALIVRGDDDYIPLSIAQAYRTTLPNAGLVAVPGVGHLMHYEQPALYLALVRAFLLDQPLPLPAR